METLKKTKPSLPANVGPVNWAGPEDAACGSSGLVHYVQLPDGAYAKTPLPAVVMVHGWGGDEAAMWIFSRLVPPGVAIITPRAPLDLSGGGAIWFKYNAITRAPHFGSLQAGIETLRRFVACLPSQYPIDPTQIVLVGFSQGAMVSNALALTRPELVCGVVSLAGAIPPMPPDLFAVVPDLSGLPVFIAHGVRDNMVPLRAAQQARDQFVQLGARVTYGEYAVGHKMNTAAMKALDEWLGETIAPTGDH